MDEKNIIQVLKLLWDGHTPGQIQKIAKKRKSLKCSKSLARNIKTMHDLIVNFLSQGGSVERTAADNSITWSIELIQIIRNHEDELTAEQTVIQEKETIEESEFLTLQTTVTNREKKRRKEKKRKADIKDLWRRKAADPEGLIEIFSSEEKMLNYAKVWVDPSTLEEFKFFCEERDLPFTETLFEIVGSLEDFHDEEIWENEELYKYVGGNIAAHISLTESTERQALRDKKFGRNLLSFICPDCGKIPIYQSKLSDLKELLGTDTDYIYVIFSYNSEYNTISCQHCNAQLYVLCPECKCKLILAKGTFKCKKCGAFYNYKNPKAPLSSGVKLPIEMPII